MIWENYYEKNKDRALRHLYLKATPYFTSQFTTALDLGCGVGTETFDLLRRGLTVKAIDQETKSIELVEDKCREFEEQLQTVVSKFENFHGWSSVDILYAYHSIPFCDELHFDSVIDNCIKCVRKNGLFIASFFGDQDEWVLSRKCMGISTQKIRFLLGEFEIIYLDEIKEFGKTVTGHEKRWHVIEVIARHH